MKITLPVRTVRDHQGNVLHREYEQTTLNPDQVRAICALFVKIIKSERKDVV